MSLAKPSNPCAQQLPKSVKVRSTCNACQQAKIRCSHEKPSCRRCQKHKVDCIYSVSRRLGRPAKKKEPRPSGQDRPVSETTELEDCARKPEKPRKKRSRGTNSATRQHAHASRCVPLEIEEDKDEASIPSERSDVDSPADLDFASKHWLQELTAQVDSDCKIIFDQPYDASELVGPLGFLSERPSILDQTSTYEEAGLSSSASSAALDFHSTLEDGFPAFQHPVAVEQPESPVAEEASAIPWLHGAQDSLEVAPFKCPWAHDALMTADALISPVDPWAQLQTIEQNNKPEPYSLADSSIVLDGASHFGCECYKHAMNELLRSGIKREVNGFSTIDSILASQKELLLQAETILRCRLCSQSEAQANMLMVIVVTIDSLLTSLDTTASPTKAFAQHEASSAVSQLEFKRQRPCSTGFKSHIDACPLQVGGFQVPGDEKAWFVRQVFQARLSTLLGTIRRIRVYMQQHLVVALSRGRLMMIMETDRRLQLILMKVKMAIG